MEKEICLCMVTVKDRPKRKLIFLRSKKADDYFSYCDEVGCEWEGLFNSITTKMDVAAILELPEKLMEKGYSNIAAGVEVPINYNEKLPDGCEIVELEPCKMVYFESEPYVNEDDYITHYETIFKAAEKYNPKNYGHEHADDIAPRFTFGTEASARYAIPIK